MNKYKCTHKKYMYLLCIIWLGSSFPFSPPEARKETMRNDVGSCFEKLENFTLLSNKPVVYFWRCDCLVLSFSQVDSDEEGGLGVQGSITSLYILLLLLCNKRTSESISKISIFTYIAKLYSALLSIVLFSE